MRNYTPQIEQALITNAAIVKFTAICCNIYNAGAATRNYWESGASQQTGHHGSWVLRQLVGIIYIAIALAALTVWRYFTQGKAETHWEFVNAVVDDGVGVYGPSPMGDAVAQWGREKISQAIIVTWQLIANLGKSYVELVVQRYGSLQARAWSVG